MREEALDPARSFIVQAPAGSGKTELLMRRFLTLLAGVEKPEQILAITFTRKAAGELRTRIIEALNRADTPHAAITTVDKKRYELAQVVSERNSLLKWDLLENPGRLKIQTIDSLCASLTRQMPILSCLGRQPSISEAPEEIYREAARRTIAMVEENGSFGDCVRTLLGRLDNSVSILESNLITMIAKRDQWLRHIDPEMDRETLKALIEASLKEVIEETLKDTIEAFPLLILNELLGPARYAAGNLSCEGVKSVITCLVDLNGVPGTRSMDLHYWRGIATLLLTKENNWKSPRGVNKRYGFPAGKNPEAVRHKKTLQDILEALAGNDHLLNCLKAARQLPDPEYDETDFEALYALQQMLLVANNHLMSVFSERGAVDFQAVAAAAINALGEEDNPTDLMLSLDLRIQHLLMDEYQDTSRNQLELIKGLTRGWYPGDGRTLFLVGDPMQSIYLFRDAEVGLFLDAKMTSIGSVQLDFLTLQSNFRSQANIIDWINQSFEAAFPDKKDEDSFLGKVGYNPFSAVNPPLDGLGVKTLLFSRQNDVAEANEITQIIESIDNKNTIAILARSRSHLKEIIKVFNDKNIPFNAQEIDPFTNCSIVQDLFALLRALMHPFDRTAWLAILRAPWCGLTLSDIHRLCLGDKMSPVRLLINNEDRLSAISGDGRKRLLPFIDSMKKALAMRGRVSPRILLEGLWIEIGGPACISADAIEDAGIFLDLLDRAGADGWAADILERLESRVKGLFTNHAGTGENSIEIMTIHKAKGLEFDHVIIPGLGKRPRATEKKLLLWMEKGSNLLLAPIEKRGKQGESPIYTYLRGIYSEKERLEQLRLFYVAATRAKKSLYLFGHVTGVDESGTVKVEPRSLLATISPGLTLDMIVTSAESDKEIAEPISPSLLLKRLPTQWSRPAPAAPIPVTAERASVASITVGSAFNWRRETLKHLGTVVHRYLSRISIEGITQWNAARLTLEKTRMKTMLLELGLSMDTANDAADKGIAILCKTLDDKRGQWLLADYLDASSELSITGIVGKKIVHGIIDRTFVYDNVRWIVDYKIGSHKGGSIMGFLAEEKEQYRGQLERYKVILQKKDESRKVMLGLYYPAIPGWIEWE